MATKKKDPKDKLKRFFDSCPTSANFDLTSDVAFTKKPRAMQKLYEEHYGYEPQPSLYHPICIQWSIKGKGFGEFVFYRDGDKLICQNEGMSKETILGIMWLLVKRCTLTDPMPKKKNK
jgi:hypothetical protein